MQFNVLSLTIKTLSFVKATHKAIERLGETSIIQKHINTGRLVIHFSLSDYQTRARSEKASQRYTQNAVLLLSGLSPGAHPDWVVVI